ncbi:Arc family DNA-binding protein [Ramlibacter sp. PS3R-8]|uniref:FitA-like ribbon-helix-helix domain-containing protein n=1 Tax=Ramlibacter sp. PS3R-8 TaxID=3133437 RepID=UPI00309E7005
MPNFSIKDVPEDLAEALRARAARNHRSLQGELMAIITEAAQPASSDGPVRHPQLQGWRRGSRTIEDVAAELRAKHPQPMRRGPLGVDIIREDRDSR